MMHYIFILLTALFVGFPSSGLAKTILTGKSEGMVYQVEEMVSRQKIMWGLASFSVGDCGVRANGQDRSMIRFNPLPFCIIRLNDPAAIAGHRLTPIWAR